MLYKSIKENIDSMVDDIAAGREECFEKLSYNIMGDQNVPINITAKLLYPLNQIQFSLYCPILLVTDDVEYIVVYHLDSEENYFEILQLISRFSTTLDRIKNWIEKEVPNMIKWGEGVVFDHHGRTKKIPPNLVV